jgi:SlyX protein
MSDENRIIELETKLAYHEDMIQSLNDTIVQQQQRLLYLEERFKGLVARLTSIEGPADSHAGDVEIPPHY